MKYYGKSKEVAEAIIDRFQNGDVPEALSQIFVNRSDDIPSSKWSWGNRFIQAIHGTSDGRGFRQWQHAGRKVKKGSKAFYILAPCIGKKKDENGEDVPILFGFKSVPVFALESTEITDREKWESCSGVDHKEEQRLEDLPLKAVADAWGIKVKSYNGKGAGALGYYSHNGVIALGTENLSTWVHELVHAADHKNKTLTVKGGQQADNEIVAEFGGAVILTLLGKKHEADLGGAWDYIKAYSKGKDPISLCCKLVNRICDCVQIILEEHDKAVQDEGTEKAA